MDGSDGSTTFTDNSNDGRTVTVLGGAQIDTSQAKFGGAAGLFDGSGDYLNVTNTSALIDFASELTIECWIRTDLSQISTVFSTREATPEGINLYTLTGGEVEFFCYGTGGGTVATATTPTGTINANTWHHLAFTRNSSGVWTIWVDGTSEATDTETGTAAQGDTYFAIGRMNRSADNFFFDGWIDDFRITKGVARYTSNFTPPTAAFPDS